jgi:RHS repeat-associated protein
MSSVTDALTPAQSSILSYDLNGNLLKEAKPNGEEKRYEYDALNQMTRAASFASNVETTLGSYDYDFEGRRISKTVGSSTTQYVYSGINVVNEFSGTNQLTASYDFGVDLVRSDFAGEGERLYFHDALGSTTSLATNTGATVARYEYDAWGKQISAVQPSANKVNYTGYRKDEETGLDYAQARYYDSSRGRFTSFDPVTENSGRMSQPQGMNFYGYVLGNPLKFIDPKGTQSQRLREQEASRNFAKQADKIEKENSPRWVWNADTNLFGVVNRPVEGKEQEISSNKGYQITIGDGEYEDLIGWWVVINAYQEGRAAFHKVRPIDSSDARLLRPDIGNVDFYLIDEDSGSIERTTGNPEGYDFLSYDIEGNDMLVYHFRNKETGKVMTGLPVDPKHRYDIWASGVSGGLGFILEERRALGAALGSDNKQFQPLDQAAIDNPGVARVGYWATFLLTMGVGASRSKLTELGLKGSLKTSATKLGSVRAFAKSIAEKIKDLRKTYAQRIIEERGSFSLKPRKWPTAKGFNWEHIFENHHPQGAIAKERIAAGGRNSYDIFYNRSKNEIKRIVSRAWENRSKLREQVSPDGVKRFMYQGTDPVTGLEIHFWYNTETRIVETAYPKISGD